MTVSKVYENKDNDLVAVVFDDGEPSNYIINPELSCYVLGDGFIAEARAGFISAPRYDFDSHIANGNLTQVAEREAAESTLIAEFGEKLLLYPQRMGESAQEIFEMELGEDTWRELVGRASGDTGVTVDLD